MSGAYDSQSCSCFEAIVTAFFFLGNSVDDIPKEWPTTVTLVVL